MGLINANAVFLPGQTSRLYADVRSRIAAAVTRSQEIVASTAKALVPVDTGELRDSIRVSPTVDNGTQVFGQVVATAPHAAYVEFGTGIRGASSAGAGDVSYDPAWPGMPAQPYLRPAIDGARRQILEEFQR